MHAPAPPEIYVVIKNNHYITVDVTFLSLHDLDVSRIGSVGNRCFESARLTAELFFPDVHCPQGRLMKLTCSERDGYRELKGCLSSL